jgi:hypothetical protein
MKASNVEDERRQNVRRLETVKSVHRNKKNSRWRNSRCRAVFTGKGLGGGRARLLLCGYDADA